MRRFPIALAAAIFVAVAFTSRPAAGEATFWWVCHQEGNGANNLILVGATDAALRHQNNHGDAITPYPDPPPPCVE